MLMMFSSGFYNMAGGRLFVLCYLCASVCSIPRGSKRYVSPVQFHEPDVNTYWWMKEKPFSKPSSALVMPTQSEEMTQICNCVPRHQCSDQLNGEKSSYNTPNGCKFGNICCNDPFPLNKPIQRLPDNAENNLVDSNGENSSPRPLRETDPDVKPEEEPKEPVQWHCGMEALHEILYEKGGDWSSNTTFGEYPWVLAVLFTGKGVIYHCGATLVTSNMAVTAAHCIDPNIQDRLVVRAGEYDLDSSESIDEPYPHEDLKIKKIIPHPDYDKRKLSNDIALLLLDGHFNTSQPHIKTICLPDADRSPPLEGSQLYGAGWGNLEAMIFPEKQRFKRHSRYKYISRTECTNEFRKLNGRYFYLNTTQICAQDRDGSSTCVGGCGGSVLYQNPQPPGQFFLVGVASRGKCAPGATGIYTNVTTYVPWITEMMDTYMSQ